MESIGLMVDGKPVDVACCMYQSQETAWPGGSHYEMRIAEPELVQFVNSTFPPGESSDIDLQHADSLFGAISLTVSMKWKKGPIRFWLNTITSLTVSQDEVVLRGDCSVHQHT